MREIKFRAKRIDNGNWVYGDYFKTPLTDENSGTKPEAGWFFLCGETRHLIGQDNVAFTVDKKTVGQFTGLLDKNGKEIFEGDIILADTTAPKLRAFVEYEAPRFKLVCETYNISDYLHHPWDLEIIGNVYENQELLK